MENNERYIVDQIKGHREQIDLDEIWAGVSPHIPKEKRKKKFGFWIWGGATMVLIVLGVIFTLNLDTDKKDNSNNISDVFPANKSNKEFTNQVTTSESSQVVNGSEEVEELPFEKTQNSNAFASNEIVHKTIIKKENTTSIDKNDISAVANNYNRTSIFSSEYEMNTNLINSQSKDEDANGEVAIFEEDKFEQKNPNGSIIVEEGSRKSSNMINPLPTTFGYVDYQNVVPKRPDVFVNLQKRDKSNLNRLSLYLMGGGSLVNRSLNSKSVELQGERDRRSNVVEVIGSWEIEGGIGFRLSPKLKIMTGLNYTQIHEKASFESDYLVDFEIESENQIIRQDGSMFNEVGIIEGQGIRHVEETRYNQFKMFQVPVRITYQVLQLDKFKLNIGALVSYSFSQSYKGFTSLSASRESYNLETDEAGKFRPNGAFTYGMTLEGTTHLTRMTDLALSLGYKTTKNISSEIYLIDQQYNSLSLVCGLRRRF